MRSERGWFLRLFALCTVLVVAFAACGGDDDDSSSGGSDSTNSTTEGKSGGEFVDLGTFVGDPPEHIDPALNVTLDAYQVVNALYDGLTEIDSTDPANPEVKPLVAESFEPNADATEWTFKIKRRPEVLERRADPAVSTFEHAWERASNRRLRR